MLIVSVNLFKFQNMKKWSNEANKKKFDEAKKQNNSNIINNKRKTEWPISKEKKNSLKFCFEKPKIIMCCAYMQVPEMCIGEWMQKILQKSLSKKCLMEVTGIFTSRYTFCWRQKWVLDDQLNYRFLRSNRISR